VEAAERMCSVLLPLCGVLFLLGVVSANDFDNLLCLYICQHPHREDFEKSQDNNNTQTKAKGLCEISNQTLRCATECPKGRPSEFLQDKLPSFLHERCPVNGSIDTAFFADFYAAIEDMAKMNEMNACGPFSRPFMSQANEACEWISTCFVDKKLASLDNKYDADVLTAVKNFLKFRKLTKYTIHNGLDAIPPKCLALLNDTPAEPSAPLDNEKDNHFFDSPVDELLVVQTWPWDDKEKENFHCLHRCVQPHVSAMESNLTDQPIICQLARHLFKCALFECPNGEASEFILKKMPVHFAGHCDNSSDDFFKKYDQLVEDAKPIFNGTVYCKSNPTTGLASRLTCKFLPTCFDRYITPRFVDKYGADVVDAYIDMKKFEILSNIANKNFTEPLPAKCLELLEDKPTEEPVERDV
jgi:hypothetical protein